MAWPDNTPEIDNTHFQNDTGTVTGTSEARAELNSLIGKLNQALDSIDQGETPWHSGNDSALMKTLANGTANDICLVDATGNPLRAGKTISTSVGADDSTVPTGKAVQDYVGQNSGASDVTMYVGGVNSNGSSINLPPGWTSSLNSGVYTVNTNGLNVFSARIVITPRTTSARFVTCDVPSPFTLFTFRVYNSSGAISSSVVGFHLAISTY